MAVRSIQIPRLTLGHGMAIALITIGVALQPTISKALTGAPPAFNAMLPAFARGIAGMLFLAAGGLRLVGARMAGCGEESPAADVLIFLGVVTPAFALAGPLVHNDAAVVEAAPAPRVLMCLTAIVVLAWHASHRHRRPVHSGQLAIELVLVWAASVVTLDFASRIFGGAVVDSVPMWQVAACCVAGGWLALAGRVLRRQRLSGTECRWVATAMAAMAGNELLWAESLGNRPAALNQALSLQVVAAAILLVLSAVHLRVNLRQHSEATESLRRAFSEAEAELSRRAAREQERIHDARTAVAGIAGAVEILTRPGTPCSMDTTHLNALMAAEITRLERTLIGLDDEPVTEFGLAEVIEPVIAAHRLSAPVVAADLNDVRAVGQAQRTATVVANLLANIRAHAPGAGAEIHVDQLPDGTAVFTVCDDGPGIPLAERGDVLTRGRRGSRAGSGTGLGLHTAITAMHRQGGSLAIDEAPTGGTRVTLTLPTRSTKPA